MRMNRLSSPPQLRFSMALFPACASHQEIQSMAADGLNLCCVEIILGGGGGARYNHRRIFEGSVGRPHRHEPSEAFGDAWMCSLRFNGRTKPAL